MNHNIEVIQGKYITIHQLNSFLDHVREMLLEHFDIPEYNDCVIILGTYVFFPITEIKKQFPNKKIIVYQLEQLMGIGTWTSIPFILKNLKDADEVWDYDYLNSVFLESSTGLKTNKIIPMLYTKSLDRIVSKENPEFDVLFYGTINDRRFKIFKKLQDQLYNKIKLAWIYGSPDLDSHIANSKIILNLHAAEPWNRQEQVRMFYTLINGKTNISEPSQLNNMPNEILEFHIDDLAQCFLQICKNDTWKSFGLQAKEKFKVRTKEFLKKEFNKTNFNF